MYELGFTFQVLVLVFELKCVANSFYNMRVNMFSDFINTHDAKHRRMFRQTQNKFVLISAQIECAE